MSVIYSTLLYMLMAYGFLLLKPIVWVMIQIRELISASTSDYDKEKAQERLAKISGGVAVLKVCINSCNIVAAPGFKWGT